MSEVLIYREEDWQADGGLSCPECGHVMQEGDQYTERLDGQMVDCAVIIVGFCPDCVPANQEKRP